MDFEKIKFHSIENIESHCMQLQSNQFKFNWKEKVCTCLYILYWKYAFNYGVGKKTSKMIDPERDLSIPLYLGINNKHVSIWNCPKDNIWNLKLSYLN